MMRVAAAGRHGSGSAVPGLSGHRARLGRSADAVRAFSGAAARTACQMLGTPAYSFNGDVVLGEQRPRAQVIAHEVFHAVQQRVGPTSATVSSTPAHPAERGAHAYARASGPMSPATTAAVPRLSLYSEEVQGSKTFRISSSRDMAVNKDGAAHESYATRSQIQGSNAALIGQDSILTLAPHSSEKLQITAPASGGSSTPSRFTGPRFDAIRAGVRSQYLRWGVEHDAVVTLQQALLDAACPLRRYGVDGRFYGETRTAVRKFQRERARFGPADVDGVVGPKTLGALDAYFGAGVPSTRTVDLPRVVPTNRRNLTSGTSLLMFNDCGYCATSIMGVMDWRNVPANPTSNSQIGAHIPSSRLPRGSYTRGGAARTTGRGWVHSIRDEILDDVMGTASGGGFTAYKGLSSSEKTRVERETGLNEYAMPGVGEAYSIARDMTGGSTYNYHWGAVIMASGVDRVVLENSWDGSQPLENNNWKYAMYGPGTQSFHSAYASSWAGPDPVTIRVTR